MTTYTPEQIAESRAKVLDAITNSIAALEACTLNDEIYAWDQGLAVGISDEGKAYAASLDKAATAADVLYVVRNGNGDRALKANRQAAIADHLATLRDLYAQTETMFANR